MLNKRAHQETFVRVVGELGNGDDDDSVISTREADRVHDDDGAVLHAHLCEGLKIIR